MSVKKLARFLSKSKSPSQKIGLKRRVEKYKRKGNKSVDINLIHKRSGRVIGHIETRATGKGVKEVDLTEVREKYKGKGIGTELFEKLSKRMRGKKLKGDLLHHHQKRIREKFSGTKIKHSIAETDIPKEGFKKSKNRSTGKVKFIRKNGRVIPVRVKK
jgi:predicted GNAT family acetyltransferase